MEVFVVSLLNGLVYGMLLFMLASGLTLILSMMGVLNFAHASAYMLGAYFAYTISTYIGFWPALIIAPLLCGLIGARSRCSGCGGSTATATSPNCCSPSAWRC
jgi:branched-chain amino acid transport system permease protein